MTEKEIVQALRCCAKGLGHDDACENCKVGEIQDRREYIEFAAANVIEHLTAENAELRKEIEWKDMVISLAQREQAKALDAADLIDRLTAENAALREKVPQWISAEERRPEPGKRVLATDGVFVGEAYRTSADTWRKYDGIAMRDCLGSIVTHWMPLPSAPKFADILRGAPEAPEEGDKA